MKKMIKNYAFMALAAMSIAACSKDEQNEIDFNGGNEKDAKLQLIVTAPRK